MTYSSFVEGITFLAWDIAWVCRTQGMPVATTTWEDLCAMGRNLYQLILVGPSSLPAKPDPAETSVAQFATDGGSNAGLKSKSRGPTKNQTSDPPLPPAPSPGHLSHDSAYAFLSTAQGLDYMIRGWKLNSPVKIVERVKAMLLAERQGAEWEVVEGEEWIEDHLGNPTAKSLPQRAIADAPSHVTPRSGLKAAVRGAAIDEAGVLIPAHTTIDVASAKTKATSMNLRERLAKLRLGDDAAKGDKDSIIQPAADGVSEKGWMKVKSRNPPTLDKGENGTD